MIVPSILYRIAITVEIFHCPFPLSFRLNYLESCGFTHLLEGPPPLVHSLLQSLWMFVVEFIIPLLKESKRFQMLPSWNKATWDLVFLSPKETTLATGPAATQLGYAELGMMCFHQRWFTAFDSYELRSTDREPFLQTTTLLDLFITFKG